MPRVLSAHTRQTILCGSGRARRPCSCPPTLYFTRRFEGATSALNAPVQVCLWAESSPATPDDAFPTEQVYSELEDFASLMPAWLGLHDPREEFAKLPAFEHLPLKIRRAYRENPGLRLSASGQLTRQYVSGDRRTAGDPTGGF